MNPLDLSRWQFGISTVCHFTLAPAAPPPPARLPVPPSPSLLTGAAPSAPRVPPGPPAAGLEPAGPAGRQP